MEAESDGRLYLCRLYAVEFLYDNNFFDLIREANKSNSASGTFSFPLPHFAVSHKLSKNVVDSKPILRRFLRESFELIVWFVNRMDECSNSVLAVK